MTDPISVLCQKYNLSGSDKVDSLTNYIANLYENIQQQTLEMQKVREIVNKYCIPDKNDTLNSQKTVSEVVEHAIENFITRKSSYQNENIVSEKLSQESQIYEQIIAEKSQKINKLKEEIENKTEYFEKEIRDLSYKLQKLNATDKIVAENADLVQKNAKLELMIDNQIKENQNLSKMNEKLKDKHYEHLSRIQVLNEVSGDIDKELGQFKTKAWLIGAGMAVIIVALLLWKLGIRK